MGNNELQLKWIDETSYSKTDKQRAPRILRCNVTKNIAFTIHKHIHFGDNWLLSSSFVGLDKCELCTSDLSDAKSKATEIMIQRLSQQKDEVGTAIDVLSKII